MASKQKKIYEWEEVRTHVENGTLILGNGASRAFDESFGYGNLYEHAVNKDLVSSDAQDIFALAKTTDFEQVLRMLYYAQYINGLYGIECTSLAGAYCAVRDALIKTVQSVHMDHADAKNSLNAAATFMRHFSIVLSLNYDLICYWALMEANTNIEHKCIKDVFLPDGFDSNWHRFREPYADGCCPNPTLLFYPHGNICISSNADANEQKVVASGGLLLEQVLESWKTDSFPVYVSEATSTIKVSRINRSHYLSTVLDSVLPSSPAEIVFFGFPSPIPTSTSSRNCFKKRRTALYSTLCAVGITTRHLQP